MRRIHAVILMASAEPAAWPEQKLNCPLIGCGVLYHDACVQAAAAPNGPAVLLSKLEPVVRPLMQS